MNALARLRQPSTSVLRYRSNCVVSDWVACEGPSNRERKISGGTTYDMKRIFLNSRGLRAGWRLLIFVGIFVGLGFLANWIVPLIFHPRDRPFLDPVGMIFDEVETLVQIIAATWIMARIERRRFADYGIPVRTTFGRDFWAGLAW